MQNNDAAGSGDVKTLKDGEAARSSGGDNGCPPFIFAFLPIFWEEDLKGKGRTMVEGPNYRWQFLISYPDTVSKEEGDRWMMEEILPKFAAMPGNIRHASCSRTHESQTRAGTKHRYCIFAHTEKRPS